MKITITQLLVMFDAILITLPVEQRAAEVRCMLAEARQMPGSTDAAMRALRWHTSLCEYCHTFLAHAGHARRCIARNAALSAVESQHARMARR